MPDNLPDQRTKSIWRSQSSPATGGFNEILFDDAKGAELLRVQAERDLRKLVKHDETITVGHDRRLSIAGNELDTTLKDRTEVTGRDRAELTDGDRTVAAEKSLRKRVRGDEIERIERDHLVTVAKDEDLLVEGTKRELVDDDSDVTVEGARHEKVGAQSLAVGGGLEEAVGSSILDAGVEIHLIAGVGFVCEAPEITVKSGGSFIRIDADGVTIVGPHVWINEGGAPESGQGVGTTTPEGPRVARVELPQRPEPADDA